MKAKSSGIGAGAASFLRRLRSPGLNHRQFKICFRKNLNDITRILFPISSLVKQGKLFETIVSWKLGTKPSNF